MNKAVTIVLIFVLLIAQIALAKNLFINRPDWLTGIFSIDMYGANSSEESWPLDRCICVFDFELDRVDKIKTPHGSIYTKEWQSGGSPVIFYPFAAIMKKYDKNTGKLQESIISATLKEVIHV